MYYAGAGKAGRRRIRLAVAAVDAPTRWQRYGVVVDNGLPGAFDGHWCVLPNVFYIGRQWHLYYSGHEGSDMGLQSFPGIGLAVSDDGYHFRKFATEPVITGNMSREYPHNRGIAGGSIIAVAQADRTFSYRYYYTLAVGTPHADVRISWEKYCAVCHSTDGIHWSDHRIVMSPRREVRTEDIAVATPVVRSDGDWYRMLYSGIGTRGDNYFISEAVSEDGYHWQRGEPGQNLVLAPGAADSWESEMVEYPALLQAKGMLHLYYCGNGYGATGIGMASAACEEE